MNPKIKNIILFVGIALVLIFVYTLLIKKDEEPSIVTSSPTLPTSGTPQPASVSGVDPETANEILTLLLSVRNITLDESVFSDIAFTSLEDSTVPLTQDGTEGRPNPFAPIGSDLQATSPASTLPTAEEIPVPETATVEVPITATPSSTSPAQ